MSRLVGRSTVADRAAVIKPLAQPSRRYDTSQYGDGGNIPAADALRAQGALQMWALPCCLFTAIVLLALTSKASPQRTGPALRNIKTLGELEAVSGALHPLLQQGLTNPLTTLDGDSVEFPYTTGAPDNNIAESAPSLLPVELCCQQRTGFQLVQTLLLLRLAQGWSMPTATAARTGRPSSSPACSPPTSRGRCCTAAS